MEKACVDCMHYHEPGGRRHGLPDPWCQRFAKDAEPPRFDPVHGRILGPVSAPDCRTARAEGGQCGPTGRSWIPNPGSPADREYTAERLAKVIREEPTPAPRPWWKFW
jgi:hypothetical protein